MEVRTYTESNIVQVEFEGRRVEIKMRNSGDGPVMFLDPMDGTSLEGEQPGMYHLVSASRADERVEGPSDHERVESFVSGDEVIYERPHDLGIMTAAVRPSPDTDGAWQVKLYTSPNEYHLEEFPNEDAAHHAAHEHSASIDQEVRDA